MQVNNFAHSKTPNYQTNRLGNSANFGNTSQYLDALKAKVPGVNILVVNSPLTSKSQLSANAFGGIGTFGTVAISRDFLEKMADDPALAEKYEKIISKVPEDMEFIKNSAPKGAKVLGAGMTIDKNGKANYWSVSATDNAAGKNELTFTQKMLEMNKGKAEKLNNTAFDFRG